MLLLGLAMVAIGLICLNRDDNSGWFGGGHGCWHHSVFDDYGTIISGVVMIGVVAITVFHNFHFTNPFSQPAAVATAAVAPPSASNARTKNSLIDKKQAAYQPQKYKHRSRSSKVQHKDQ